ncbi:MAG: hypothetical protein LBR80_09220 [Deltaproteobacteria bacterium]|jgi:hypothetical protein|nr:hypothetical protein [Deltaproteobacteria bacterium]
MPLYKPSGAASPASILILPAAAVLSLVLAPLYAACSLYVPFIYLNIIFAVLFGAAAGVAGGAAAKATSTQSPLLAGLLAAVGGWVGFVLSWSVWISLFLAFEGPSFPGFSDVMDFMTQPNVWFLPLEYPNEHLQFLKQLNEEGIWTIGRKSSSTVSGYLYLAVWIGEFLLFTIMAATTSASAARRPYSNEARSFLKGEPSPRLGVAFPEEPGVLPQVERSMSDGNLGYLTSAPTVEGGGPGYFVTIFSHPQSPWGTVTVTKTEQKGKKLEKKVLVANAVLQGGEIGLLRARLT